MRLKIRAYKIRTGLEFKPRIPANRIEWATATGLSDLVGTTLDAFFHG